MMTENVDHIQSVPRNLDERVLDVIPTILGGGVQKVTPIGQSGSTWLLANGQGTVVVKQMAPSRSLHDFERIFEGLARLDPAVSPPLLATIPAEAGWYAVFTYVDGVIPQPGTLAWSGYWQAGLALLDRMRAYRHVPATWPLESIWLSRLSEFEFGWAPAADLLERLVTTSPCGPRTLAHGDFNAQNIVATKTGPVLIDWEECGSAPVGFDAGWLLALNRVGSGPRLPSRYLFAHFIGRSYPAANLFWFEALGLLRLLYRSHTLPLSPPVRLAVTARVQEVLRDYAESGNWQ